MTLNRLVAELRDLLDADVEPIYAAPRAGDIRHSLADLSTARAELGYEPAVLLREGSSARSSTSALTELRGQLMSAFATDGWQLRRRRRVARSGDPGGDPRRQTDRLLRPPARVPQARSGDPVSRRRRRARGVPGRRVCSSQGRAASCSCCSAAPSGCGCSARSTTASPCRRCGGCWPRQAPARALRRRSRLEHLGAGSARPRARRSSGSWAWSTRST